MTANYILLERIELTASAASVTFNNIPQSGYTDLKIVSSVLSTSTSGVGSVYMTMALNGVTTNRTFKRVYGVGSTAGGDGGSLAQAGSVNTSAASTSIFSSHEFYIPNYTSSDFKSISIDTVAEANSASNEIDMMAGLWSANAAINSITFALSSGNFAANSTFSIYGLAAVGTTPAIAPKASGGNIQTDGTYWYHTFLASGTFTPQVNLTCDVLQVAGGGGGGIYGGGGGGAGGFLAFASQAITTAQTVIVGSGGAALTSGSNSQFGSLTASVGGGRGGYDTPGGQGQNGGSGGGGGSGSTSTAAGSGTSGQGNAGGVGVSSGAYTGGGGGGAGASGTAGNGSNSGNGGAGLNTYSSWASATGTGASGYYAGGGGGGGYYGIGSGGVAGAGGGGAGSSSTATSGTANTGGGGGGGNGTATLGGSGLVIIRYPIA